MPEEFEGSEGGSGSDNGESGINHSWDPVLNLIPEDVRQQALPHFQNWDRGVQQRFQQLQQTYSPYKSFAEQGVDPQDLEYAYGLLNALQEDPEKVWKAIGEHHQFMNGQQSGDPGQGLPNGQENTGAQEQQLQLPPEYQGLPDMVTTIGEFLINQQQQQEEEAEDTALDQELTELKQKYGEFDESYVLGQMYSGMEAEEAVQNFFAFVQKITGASQPIAPRVLGSGGVIPTAQGVDVKTLDRSQTKGLVADLLRSQQQF